MRHSLPLCLALLLSSQACGSPFPGGVLDSTGRTAYLATGEAVTAVELSSGEVRWRSDEATEPLFVVTDRLYALAATKAGRLFIRSLNLNDRGQRLFESDPIELPRWAIPENAPGRSFTFRWSREKSQLSLSWQVAAWADGSPRKQSSGAASVDLMTGKVRAQEGSEPHPEKLPGVLERLAVRWQVSHSGRVRAVVQEDQAGSSQTQRRRALVFRRWDERGRELSPRELLRCQDPIVLTDAAGGRLWLRDGSPPPDRGTQEPRWLVVDMSEGQEIATVPVVGGTTAATILGKRAYFLVPSGVRLGLGDTLRRGRALVAVDLDTGKVAWRRPL